MDKHMVWKILEAHADAVNHFHDALTSKERERYNTEAATYVKILDMADVNYSIDEYGYIVLSK